MVETEQTPEQILAYFEAIEDPERAITREELEMLETMLPHWGVSLNYFHRGDSTEHTEQYCFTRQLPRGFLVTDEWKGEVLQTTQATDFSLPGTLGEYDRLNLVLYFGNFPNARLVPNLWEIEQSIAGLEST